LNLPQFLGFFAERPLPASTFFSSPAPEGTFHGFMRRQHDTLTLWDQNHWVSLRPEQLPLPEESASGQTFWCGLKRVKGQLRLRYLLPQKDAVPAAHQSRLHTYFLMLQTIRCFFLERQFLEVATSALTTAGAVEPFLDCFEFGPVQLRTSPEMAMKGLLSQGFQRIFQLAPSFRKEPSGRHHTQEFLMLEWYRTFADLSAIESDLGALLSHLGDQFTDNLYWQKPLRRQSVHQLFDRYLGIDLNHHQTLNEMASLCRKRQLNVMPDDDWDDLFFRLWLDAIEPHLGQEAPELVTDYPASQAALAKMNRRQPNHLPTCLRFECYVQGIELANAFYEVTSKAEQHKRLLASRSQRQFNHQTPHPIDPAFLQALDRGLPPSAGIALGVERLCALLLGESDIAAFPTTCTFPPQGDPT
jgi:lysyl-tRNA synthetase class 2